MKQYTKKYGQVFLKDRNIRDMEVNILDPKPDEDIVEIGPGEGFLTEKLLESGANIICIESDHRFSDYIKAKFSGFVSSGRLQVIHGDFLKYDLKRCSKIIGNIPYHISSPILEKMASIEFQKAVLMVQEEFARRMMANNNSKDYSRLSLFTYIHFDANLEKIVSRNCFHPKPDVNSAIVTLRPARRIRDVPEQYIDNILRMLFSNRRKKIGNSLPGTPYDDLRIEQLDRDKILDIVELTYQNRKPGSY
ncbi:16S rRNA (adenine(1518)-N(6)/adenine(1519)-N(6))-dimethyltransferase RsmA [Cuniculiplasma sp. SKW3]|uniref:16S rRNA (adenine(1518)-N(6)/adenine(1519)-N(6))- dimethyltransferase RsmA n=1 Tax=Cuniculiplasma sp. SKW3 TaxID=3400170 RepID=UPI003FD02E5E